ncbi:Protein of unknown function [Pyronema omphalodes CBS 100304]|uniref:Uncharacterized protein n=1 Tax=Pyronema omphalodes (strain CBS 100304) TaxID=1076935 RepID=U4LAF3_PYROM|nr:Protein of unknown function [Pyronema omphalodes CBS 100304]
MRTTKKPFSKVPLLATKATYQQLAIKENFPKQSLEVIRRFVYDHGLTGGSNEELMEELYSGMGLNEDEVAR